MKKQLYPSRYELFQVLSSMVSASFTRTFGQRRGLFVTNVKQEEIAKEITKLYLDDADLEEIRLEAYQQKVSHSLSGLIINSSTNNLNLVKTYEWILENGRQGINVVLTGLRKIQEGEDSSQYKGTYSYKKQKPGRIEFLQDEENSFDFYLEELPEGKWKIEVDSTKSTDFKEIQNLFERELTREDNFETIDERLLTTDSSIKFFDSLSSYGQDTGWSITQIKHLSIRKSSESGEEIVEEAKNEELDGISQAIIEGTNLRENRFVEGAVNSGFSFTAMTYEFENTKRPYAMEIKAEFKGRPKVFEVTILAYFELRGTSKSKNESTLSPEDNLRLRSEFWNFAKGSFDKLKKKRM